MHRYHEEKLPEGYKEALALDANDRKSSGKVGMIAVVSAIILFNACFFLYALPRIHKIAPGFSIIKCIGFILAYFVLHNSSRIDARYRL